TGRALLFPRQGQLHAGKYLMGLARAASRYGARIFTGAHVTTFEGGENGHVTTADSFTVKTKAIRVCTNSPVNDRITNHTKQMPYRTYVVAAKVPKGHVAKALYWDDAEPYHYVRLQKAEDPGADYEYLIIGGEDHRTGQAFDYQQRFDRLELWARLRWPRVGEVVIRWSGQVMET